MSAGLRIVTALMMLAIAGGVILAEGGWRAVLADPPLLAFLAISLGLIVASNFTSGNLSSGVREDKANRWVMLVFGVLGVASIVVSLVLDRAGVGTLDGQATRWLGVALYGVGGVLRLAPVFVLGRRFSGLVAIQEGHTLVTDGLYARIRNPSYLGLLVNALGLALTFRSGPGALLALALFWPLHARMDAEERLLESQFGDAYRVYRGRTARLVPGLY